MKMNIPCLLLALLLALLPLAALAEAPAADAWTAQAPCFSEAPDHQYQDASRSIQIKKYEAGGVTFFVADVQIASAQLLQTALCSGNLEPLSAMAARSGAVLAINADDYGTHKYGTIIRNGQLLRTHDTTRNMLVVDSAGNFSVRTDRAAEDPSALGQQLVDAGVWQTFEFGPELIRDGQAVEFSRAFDVISTDPNRREPRTAIGQIGALHYIIVVADGRQNGYSSGMTLPELQQVFLTFGTQTAMNLDGGGSAELWLNGQIINQPSQGKERSLSDILFF